MQIQLKVFAKLTVAASLVRELPVQGLAFTTLAFVSERSASCPHQSQLRRLTEVVGERIASKESHETVQFSDTVLQGGTR